MILQYILLVKCIGILYFIYHLDNISMMFFLIFSLVKRTHNKRKKMLMNFNIIQRQIFSINSTYIQTQFKHLDIESKLECNTNFE